MRFNDKGRVSVDVGAYQPNAWGLHDMHGNVCEWTRTTYRAYPYREDDGRNEQETRFLQENGFLGASSTKVVRGGSWDDRPKDARSGCRLSYLPWQRVYNVGFRVVCE